MKKRQLVLSRPLYMVALFGGQSSVTLSVGSIVDLHPASDLWMQGAKTAEIRRLSNDGESIAVRPIVMGSPVRGKLRYIGASDVDVERMCKGTGA